MEGITFKICVQPKASKNYICNQNNELKVYITSPPVDGEANTNLIKYLSKIFDTSKSNIKILKGERSKNKLIFIQGDKIKLENRLKELKNIYD